MRAEPNLRSAAALLLLLAAPLPAVHAEERPPLTREALATCRATDRTLKDQDAAIATARAGLAPTLAELQALQADLDARGKTLKDTNAAAVAAYNALIDTHQQQADAFNAKVAALNDDVAALNAGRAAYDRECAGRAYDEADLEAIEGHSRSGNSTSPSARSP